MSREKKDSRQELLQYGATVALSLGGLLYSFLRSREIKKNSQSSSDDGGQIHSRGNINDDQAKRGLWNSSSIGQERYLQEELPLPTCSNESFTSDLSPTSVVNRGKDFSFSSRKTGFSTNNDKDALASDEEISEEYKCVDNSGCGSEQEFRRLRNMVKILEEKERSLEIQLLEYYGLKEQETAITELQNRLKLSNMETKLLNLKIQSLQAEKRKLEEQVADQARVAGELEAAKSQIKLLKKKLRSEAEQNRKNIVALQERVEKIQEEENVTVAANNLDIQTKLQKLKDLEEEAEDLRKTNSTLRLEQSELAQNLEYVQLIATSVMDDDEATKLKKECHHLRNENEEFMKKVELLQADRCSDAEEMVYLRWVNACLRYELRNYQPSHGRTIARELSKKLSPESEEKAKQLILEYGSTEVMTGKGSNPTEYDAGRLISSQLSDVTDSGEYTSIDILSHSKAKSKGFGKLMRLLQGKDSSNQYQVPSGERSAYIEDMVEKFSGDSPESHSGVSTVTGTNRTTTRSTSRGSRYSLDLQRTSDEGSLCIFRSIDSILENTISMQPNKPDQTSENIKKSELVKYAEALKASRNNPLKRRSVSSSF